MELYFYFSFLGIWSGSKNLSYKPATVGNLQTTSVWFPVLLRSIMVVIVDRAKAILFHQRKLRWNWLSLVFMFRLGHILILRHSSVSLDNLLSIVQGVCYY